MEKERIEREKREKLAEEKEAAAQRGQERKDVPAEVNRMIEDLKEWTAKVKADRSDESSSSALSTSVHAAQTLLQDKTSDGSNLVTVNIGRDKLNNAMKKGSTLLASLQPATEDEVREESEILNGEEDTGNVAKGVEQESESNKDVDSGSREADVANVPLREAEKEMEKGEEKEGEREKERESEKEKEKELQHEKERGKRALAKDHKMSQDMKKDKVPTPPLSKKAQKKHDAMIAAAATPAARVTTNNKIPNGHMRAGLGTTSAPLQQQRGFASGAAPSSSSATSAYGKTSSKAMSVPIGQQQKIIAQQKVGRPRMEQGMPRRETSFDATVDKLCALGFDVRYCQEAVNRYGNDFDRAANWLMNFHAQKRTDQSKQHEYQKLHQTQMLQQHKVLQQQQQQPKTFQQQQQQLPSSYYGAQIGLGLDVSPSRGNAHNIGQNAPGFDRTSNTTSVPKQSYPHDVSSSSAAASGNHKGPWTGANDQM